MTPTQKSQAERLAEEHREKLAEKIAVTGDFIEFDDIEEAYAKGYTAAEERARTLAEEANRFFKKAWENAKVNADTYDREWTAKHPGLDHGFCANHWRAAEQHILMCWSGFKVLINDWEDGK